MVPYNTEIENVCNCYASPMKRHKLRNILYRAHSYSNSKTKVEPYSKWLFIRLLRQTIRNGAASTWRFLIITENPIVEIRKSYDRLISTMGFSVLKTGSLFWNMPETSQVCTCPGWGTCLLSQHMPMNTYEYLWIAMNSHHFCTISHHHGAMFNSSQPHGIVKVVSVCSSSFSICSQSPWNFSVTWGNLIRAFSTLLDLCVGNQLVINRLCQNAKLLSYIVIHLHYTQADA